MRVLVTGADGFVGRHLVRHLTEEGHTVLRVSGPAPVEGHLPLDVTDGEQVNALVVSLKPDAVVHLAGLSSVAESHRDPLRAFRVNALGTVHLLEALRVHAPRARLLLISSGEVYGRTVAGKLAQEDDPPGPLSPYASAKAAAEVVALQYARLGQHVLIARPFNHLGAGQHRSFVVPSFAGQLRDIAAGAKPPRLQVGNLEAVRDFSHVEDVVRAYALLLSRGEAGSVTNVASGVGRSVRELLDELIAVSGLKVTVEVDPARFRPVDAAQLVGSADRLRALGWVPQHTIAEALTEALADLSA